MEKTRNIANRYFDIKLEDGFINSLRSMQDDNKTEFIWEGNSFGHVHLKARTKSNEIIVINTDEEDLENSKDLQVSTSFKDENKRIVFEVELSNNGDESLDIVDLAIPFPMNSRFDWGESAAERVIRHSFISGHNSYIFFTRCDGKGPYLLFMPLDGAKFEFFDRFDDKTKKYRLHDVPAKHYRAYIHSKEEGDIAKSKGTNWRQENTYYTIEPSERVKYSFAMVWARDYEEIRQHLYENDLIDIEVIPGMTIPTDLYARVCLKSKYKDIEILPEFPEDTKIVKGAQEGNKVFYDIYFRRLGENKLTLSYGEGKESILEFFITEPIEDLIKKRGNFIKEKQHRDKSKWYNGLLGEWSNDTSLLLGPDNYDRIGGWRIYEVTCDDPGLSKPAFLSGKNAIYPNEDEVEALEYYIDNFVWGGLQRTEEEEFAYGIYGIPDWYQNRNSEDDGPRGQLHIWRIYDYPHIILMYYNMYLIGRNFPSIELNKPKEVYLERAYRTALAMFTIPDEITDWTAYRTGLYNELIIDEIIEELLKVGQKEQSMRLRFHWEKKVRYFINECTDVFGSEYPFDTTGFETTHALANYALKDGEMNPEKGEKAYARDKAIRFMENQMSCNIACRGWLEPAYYLLGSDYRGCSAAYTLSYMSQMGGWAIMDYAMSFSDDPHKYLRLGYASMLSSWALMNTGTADTDYGYWFSGEDSDGAAGGGFEPAPYGETWLNQPHARGSWYYSCEIDLGYCGALRGAATVLSFDDKFGLFCFGGSLTEEESILKIEPRDGVRQRFGIVKDSLKLNLELDRGNFSKDTPILVDKDLDRIEFTLDIEDVKEKIGINIYLADAAYRVLDKEGREIATVDNEAKTLYLDSSYKAENIVLTRIEE